jgi:hypothetical protein
MGEGRFVLGGECRGACKTQTRHTAVHRVPQEALPTGALQTPPKILFMVNCKREDRAQTHRPGAIAYTGSFSRGVREGVPVSKEALPHRGRSRAAERSKTHHTYAVE